MFYQCVYWSKLLFIYVKSSKSYIHLSISYSVFINTSSFNSIGRVIFNWGTTVRQYVFEILEIVLALTKNFKTRGFIFVAGYMKIKF